jgi:hypothetical protein
MDAAAAIVTMRSVHAVLVQTTKHYAVSSVRLSPAATMGTAIQLVEQFLLHLVVYAELIQTIAA